MKLTNKTLTWLVAGMVSIALVSTQVSTETTVNDSEIIEVNAVFQANTLLSHRKDITRYRSLVSKLLSEIEVETDNPEPFAELADMIIWQSQDGDTVQTKDEVNRMNRMQSLFDRVMSNPGRVDSMKKLADIMKILIALERQAIGLKDDAPPPRSDKDEEITRIERVIVEM